MRYYREKLLLALLERLESAVNGVQLQKLMFLLSDRQVSRSYDFMPYRFGCFSMQLHVDLARLQDEGYVIHSDDGYIIIRRDMGFFKYLKKSDAQDVISVANRFGNMSMRDLIRHTYLNYPFFASKSTINKEDYFSRDEIERMNRAIPHEYERTLFTIGYEGRTLEKYIGMLIKSDIRVLCDVRKIAYSHKFGFSKSSLKNACEAVGIQYQHFPELGIVSDKRQSLNTQHDYDRLFDDYEISVLPNCRDALNQIYLLLQKDRRIALTCFEYDPNQCHRLRVANKLMSINQCNYKLINL